MQCQMKLYAAVFAHFNHEFLQKSTIRQQWSHIEKLKHLPLSIAAQENKSHDNK